MAGRRLALIAALPLSLQAAGAHAAEIDWSAPAGCPDAAELRFGIERALRMPLHDAAPLKFGVRAEQTERGYSARVKIDAHPGAPDRERELEARDCVGLADRVTVAITLALGAAAAGDEEAAATTSQPPAAPASSVPRVAAPADTATPRDTAARPVEPWRPLFSAWFLGDVGALPRPAAGAGIGAQLHRGGLALRALGTLLFEQRHALISEQTPAPSATLGLLAASLSACAVPGGAGDPPLSASICLGWELGRLAGEGSGVLEARSDAALWSAPRLDLATSLAFAVAGLRLGGMLTLAAPLTRDDYVLRGFGAVHRPAAVAGRLAIGLEWSL